MVECYHDQPGKVNAVLYTSAVALLIEHRYDYNMFQRDSIAAQEITSHQVFREDS